MSDYYNFEGSNVNTPNNIPQSPEAINPTSTTKISKDQIDLDSLYQALSERQKEDQLKEQKRIEEQQKIELQKKQDETIKNNIAKFQSAPEEKKKIIGNALQELQKVSQVEQGLVLNYLQETLLANIKKNNSNASDDEIYEYIAEELKTNPHNYFFTSQESTAQATDNLIKNYSKFQETKKGKNMDNNQNNQNNNTNNDPNYIPQHRPDNYNLYQQNQNNQDTIPDVSSVINETKELSSSFVEIVRNHPSYQPVPVNLDLKNGGDIEAGMYILQSAKNQKIRENVAKKLEGELKKSLSIIGKAELLKEEQKLTQQKMQHLKMQYEQLQGKKIENSLQEKYKRFF